MEINKEFESKLSAVELASKYELTDEYVTFTHNLLLAIECKLPVKDALRSVAHCKGQMSAIDARVIDMLMQRVQAGSDYTEALKNCFIHFGGKAKRTPRKTQEIESLEVYGNELIARCDNGTDYCLRYNSECDAQRAKETFLKLGYIEVNR